MTRETPEETGWLPPGQVETRRFPVVGERTPALPDEAAWRLEIDGLVGQPLALTLGALRALPAEDVTCDLHCVTRWSQRGMRFRGIRLASLLERVGVRDEARYVRFVAYSPRDHDTSIPRAVAETGTWLVHTLDGEPLAPLHGGPVRTLTPSLYLYKSLKWVRRVELLAEDHLGFWERDEGYHNDADPWREQRYLTGDVKRKVATALGAATRLAPFRGKLLLGLDLRDWRPPERDLSGLVLKNADLRGAQLGGVVFRDGWLTCADLRGADLAGADLRGTDLEGARLAGADLSGADLRGASLVGTLFHEPGDVAGAARVKGMRRAQGSGLLEVMEAFLAASDALPPDQ